MKASIGIQQNKPKFLELFSGNADVTKRFKKGGYDAISVDYNVLKAADLHADAYALSVGFLNTFDFIWASPDCTTYSFAAHGKHRKKGGVPISEYAKQCDENNALLVSKLMESGKPFIIENPRAFLRQMPFMQRLNRYTVYYSRYGAPYSKPTDIFTNVALFGLDERPLMTKNIWIMSNRMTILTAGAKYHQCL